MIGHWEAALTSGQKVTDATKAPGRTAHRLETGALLPKSLAEDTHGSQPSQTAQDAGGSVWLRVAHPVTWEEMTSTERDGDNSDSLPAHLSQSWGFDALALVDGSRGDSPPPGKGTLPPPREGRATQGAASRSPV